MSLLDHFETLPCVKCGKPKNQGCACWVLLECGGCGKKKYAERDETDPKGTERIRMLCPECAKGDCSLIDYFDKNGRQLKPL